MSPARRFAGWIVVAIVVLVVLVVAPWVLTDGGNLLSKYAYVAGVVYAILYFGLNYTGTNREGANAKPIDEKGAADLFISVLDYSFSLYAAITVGGLIANGTFGQVGLNPDTIDAIGVAVIVMAARPVWRFYSVAREVLKTPTVVPKAT